MSGDPRVISELETFIAANSSSRDEAASETPSIIQMNAQELCEAILDHHEKIVKCSESILDNAIAAGAHLARLKLQCSRGQFRTLIIGKTPLKMRTVQRYIEVHEYSKAIDVSAIRERIGNSITAFLRYAKANRSIEKVAPPRTGNFDALNSSFAKIHKSISNFHLLCKDPSSLSDQTSTERRARIQHLSNILHVLTSQILEEIQSGKELNLFELMQDLSRKQRSPTFDPGSIQDIRYKSSARNAAGSQARSARGRRPPTEIPGRRY